MSSQRDSVLWGVLIRSISIGYNTLVQYGKRVKSLKEFSECEEPLPEVRSRPKNSKGRNLLNRLKAYPTSVFAFAFEKGIPFTNNLAEQGIRCIKIKLKVAMCFHTFEGLKVYARSKGVIKTFIKKGINVFQNLLKINLNQKIDLAT